MNANTSTDPETRRAALAAALEKVPSAMLTHELRRRGEYTAHLHADAQGFITPDMDTLASLAGEHLPVVLAAGRAWHIDPAQIFTRRRDGFIVGARQTVMSILRESGLTLHQVAGILCMHHSSVVNAIHTTDRWKRYRSPELNRYLATKNQLTTAKP